MTTVEPRVLSAWQHIEAWLAQHSPGALAALGEPADEHLLHRFEDALGMPLPAEVRASYLVHDGQQRTGPYTFGDWTLMTLDESLREWRFLKELLESGTMDPSCEAVGPVCPMWWNPRWIPVLANGCGDFQCLDLVPEPGGCVGQLIVFWHTYDPREVVAQSMLELLERWANDLESGAIVAGENGWLLRTTKAE